MPNSNVVNLYPVPNDQATVKQASIAIPVSGSGAVSFTTLFENYIVILDI